MITTDQISKSELCVCCHQVAVHLGIKLEIVWDEYRASPAFKAGITCQDCHMGTEPGKTDGYRPRRRRWSTAGRSTRDANTRITVRRTGLFHRPPRHLPAPPQGGGLPHQGLAGVRLPRGLGHERVRGQGRRRLGEVDFPRRWSDPVDGKRRGRSSTTISRRSKRRTSSGTR